MKKQDKVKRTEFKVSGLTRKPNVSLANYIINTEC